MDKTAGYCQIFPRATQELMQLQQFSIWICPLPHSGTRGFHFKYSLRRKCRSHFSFTLPPLSDHPFTSGHPRSLSVRVPMEQAFCNATAYTVPATGASLTTSVLRTFLTSPSDNRPNASPFTERNKEKTGENQSHNALPKETGDDFRARSSKLANRRGDEPTARVAVVAQGCKCLKRHTEKTHTGNRAPGPQGTAYAHSWRPPWEDAELDPSRVFCSYAAQTASLET